MTVDSSLTDPASYSSKFIDYECESSSQGTETNEKEDEVLHSEKNFNLKNPFSPLYQSADISNIEAFSCILAFCVRFNLSGVCIEELLRLLKILLPPCTIPASKYLLNKSIKSSADFDAFYKIHLYCSNCNEYVTEIKDSQEEILCDFCQEKKLSSEFLDKGNFFLYIPLEEQIRRKFENQCLFEEIKIYRAQCMKETHYKDVICGENYSVPANNLSLQFSVDGIPLYNKSKYDLWPIHCMINELPPAQRKANIMMCGLWFGSKKPVFKAYLKPFVEELNALCETGFSWNNNGSKFMSKVFPIICTADAPARAMLQNFNQFNGKYGCGFCEHEGERIERGRGHSRIYKS